MSSLLSSPCGNILSCVNEFACKMKNLNVSRNGYVDCMNEFASVDLSLQ